MKSKQDLLKQDLLERPILASVTFAPSAENVAVKHEFEQRNVKIIAPKGYYYLPEVDDKVLLSGIETNLVLGCLNFEDSALEQTQKLKPGEIVIQNNSGATIKLLSNGDVQINSLTITKSGEIIN